MFIDPSISPSVLTALLVGNIAAMTLTVSGLRSMYELANNAFSNNRKKIVIKNDRIYTLEFGVLEYTYVVTLCFGLSELFALIYIGINSETLLILGLLSLFSGLIITIFLYTSLRNLGLSKSEIDVSDFSDLYGSA